MSKIVDTSRDESETSAANPRNSTTFRGVHANLQRMLRTAPTTTEVERHLPASRTLDRLLGAVARAAIRTAVQGLSTGARLHAHATRALVDLERSSNLRYGHEHEHQTLDLWQLHEPAGGPRPVLLYFHGGGFQLLSKDTHWHMAAQFARAGFVVMSCNYGLAPQHPFPQAPHDALSAYRYAAEQARALGGDPHRIVVAGESAGANLALGVGLAATEVCTDARASSVRATGIVPAAILSYSGLLQASEMGRFFRGSRTPRIVRARVESLSRDYLGQPADAKAPTPARMLLDPLLFLERQSNVGARLPPVFASAGTRDPIRSDTLRLEAWLKAHAKPHRVDIFAGEPHAFEAMRLRAASKEVFEGTLSFLRGLDVIA